MFDPFAGSGTVLVEGMLAGITTIAGNDINPLALFISEAKTTVLDAALLKAEVAQLYDRISYLIGEYFQQIEYVNDIMQNSMGLDLTSSKGWGDNAPKYLKEYYEKNEVNLEIPDFKNIGYWCKPKAIMLLSVIKTEIAKITDDSIQRFVYIAFSETIRLVSNRRNGEFKMFRMQPAKVASFDPDVYKEFKNLLDKNVEKMSDFSDYIASKGNHSAVMIYRDNVCQLNDVPDDLYDLIITSPPYGDSRTRKSWRKILKEPAMYSAFTVTLIKQ